VAVTVYFPGALTIAGFGVLLSEPPFQTIVLPILLPVMVTEELEQVKFPLLLAVTPGFMVLDATVTIAVSMQPCVSVAVTI
jgi:hypothetical protein